MEGEDGDSSSKEKPAGGIKDRFEVVVECRAEEQERRCLRS